jgi:hypothetical protein
VDDDVDEVDELLVVDDDVDEAGVLVVDEVPLGQTPPGGSMMSLEWLEWASRLTFGRRL